VEKRGARCYNKRVWENLDRRGGSYITGALVKGTKKEKRP